jgi:predicted DNA-binding transcriptional regulator AlpA
MDEKSSLTDKVFLTRADLKALGIWQSNSTLLRLEAAGRMPRRIRIGGTSVCWDYAEIKAWIDERRAERVNHHYADAKL